MAKLSVGWQNAKILGNVFDQLSDALILYDTSQVITGVNAAAERLFGMSAEALIGRDCHEMFRCQVCEPGCGMQSGLVQVNGHNATVRLHTQNGMERLVVIHTSQLVREDGTVEGRGGHDQGRDRGNRAPEARNRSPNRPPCAMC